jgi:putative DNA primase/helicase
VKSVEVSEGQKLAEGLVKNLTGGDVVTARFLYQAVFEFRPAFKLWLAANAAPRIDHEDDAIWRRILRVPFEHTVPKDRATRRSRPR